MLFQNYNNIENLTDDRLIEQSTRKTIRKWVVIAHVSVIVLPLIWIAISSFFEDDEVKETFVATVITLPPVQKQPATEPVAAPPKKEQKSKPVIKETPKPPVKKKAPVKKKTPPKPVAKKKVTPKKPTKPKKEWKAKDASQITLPSDFDSPKPVITKPIYIPKVNINTPKLSSTLTKINTRINVSSKTNINVTNSRAAQSYYSSVGSLLYQRWDQPSSTELGGRKPSAIVTVEVSSSGRLLSYRISKASRISAMDRSVRKLMDSITQLGNPPKGIRKFEISLAVR